MGMTRLVLLYVALILLLDMKAGLGKSSHGGSRGTRGQSRNLHDISRFKLGNGTLPCLFHSIGQPVTRLNINQGCKEEGKIGLIMQLTRANGQEIHKLKFIFFLDRMLRNKYGGCRAET